MTDPSNLIKMLMGSLGAANNSTKIGIAIEILKISLEYKKKPEEVIKELTDIINKWKE